MSIHDAIMALSPLHYWTFGTAAGDLTAPDLVGTLNFTSAVNDGGGITGPEMGTTAQRLFSDQVWTTPGLGVTAYTTQTWLVLLSAPNIGGVPSYVDLMGFGDVSNRTARGWRLHTLSNSNGVGSSQLIWPSAAVSTQSTPGPYNGWHLLWWTINPSPLGWALNSETNTNSLNTVTIGANPLTTDQVWIQSSAAMVIAHLAAFNVVLNATQVATIGSQLVNWPTQIPINMPQTTGTATVDLTPVLTDTAHILSNQAVVDPIIQTQIPAINTTTTNIQTTTNTINTTTQSTHTDTQNIVNTLFPQLETPINYIAQTVGDILNGITTTVTTAAGTVSAKIGEFFTQHSKDQLGVFNPTSGPTCTHIHWVAGAAAYWGLTVEITSYPTEWTFTTPAGDWSIRDLAVLVISIGGDQVVRYGVHTTSYSLSPLPETFPFEIAGVGVPVTPPGYTIDVYWAGGVCGQLLLYYVPV